MDGISMVVNSLPAPTWEKLGMNRANIENICVDKVNIPTVKKSQNANAWEDVENSSKISFAESKFNSIETGMGAELSKLLEGVCTEAEYIEASPIATTNESCNVADCPQAQKCPKAIPTTALYYTFSAGKNTGSRVCIDAAENSESVVIMDFYADMETSGTAAVQTLVALAANAKLHLVQVFRAGKKYRFLNDIGTKQDENSEFKLTQLFLTGEETYSGLHAGLFGKNSRIETNIGYELESKQKLDMNYVARHIGKYTDSRITAMGSLKDNSYKLFRGTIDFVNGCAGAVGNENEEVLIVDEGAINKTIPLILCAEEDVEGNHGASIGRPDEEIIFYLASRGIKEEDAIKMLCQAKLDAVARHIPTEDYKCKILEYIHGNGLR